MCRRIRNSKIQRRCRCIRATARAGISPDSEQFAIRSAILPIRLDSRTRFFPPPSDRRPSKAASLLYLEGYARGQQCLHALRSPDPVRGRHLHLHGGPPLRHLRPQRRRQVHADENPHRRARAYQGLDHASQALRHPAPGSVRVRRISRDRHRDHGQRRLVEGARRNATRSTRSHTTS